MTSRRSNTVTLYRDRIRPSVGRTHRNEGGDPSGMCQPQYRGWRLACLAAEILARQRAIDEYWDRRYAEAESPADKITVLMAERHQRNQPEDWPC